RATLFHTCSIGILDLHTFPTRRSSDLTYRHHPASGDPSVLVLGVGGGASVLGTDACDAAGLDVRRLNDDLIELLRALGYGAGTRDRKSTRLNSSHLGISYAVFCLKKKK